MSLSLCQRFALPVILSSLLFSIVSKAQTIGASDVQGVTQLDNPWIDFEVDLDGDERAEANTDGYDYRNFWVFGVQSCEDEDALCGAPANATFDVVPVDSQVDGSEAAAWPFRMRGLNLGLGTATVRGVKSTDDLVDEDGTEVEEHDIFSTDVRLDGEVILVPVHVVLEAPHPDAAFDTTQAGILEGVADDSLSLFRSLFDDKRIGAVSGGGGERTVGIFDPPRMSYLNWGSQQVGRLDLVRPDEVFAQCGVQFRMVSYTVFRSGYAQLSREPYPPLNNWSSGNSFLPNLPARVRGEETVLGTSSQGVQFTNAEDIVQTIWGDTSIEQGLWAVFMADLGLTAGGAYGVTVGRVAAVDVTAIGPKFVLAHELGHALGLGHAFSGNLMSLDMTGTLSGCAAWRQGVEFEDGDVPLPYGCESESLDRGQCATIRQKAASWTGTYGGNLPPEVALFIDGQEVTGANTSFVPSIELSCGQEVTLTAEVRNSPGDVETRLAAFGWDVDDPAFVLETSEDSITIVPPPEQLGSESRIRVGYYAADIRGATDESQRVHLIYPLDLEEPQVVLDEGGRVLSECASGESVFLTLPDVVDNCGAVELTGRVVARNGEEFSQPEEIGADGNVVLGAGVNLVEWTATDVKGNISTATEEITVEACFAARQSLKVSNGVSLLNREGDPAALMVTGSGSLEIAGQSHVGDVVSAGDVRIEGGSVVSGDVISGGSVTLQQGATVEGQILADQEFVLRQSQHSRPSWPSSCESALVFHAGLSGTQTAEEGCYRGLSVGSRTTFEFQAGVYFLDSLNVESGAILIVPNDAVVHVDQALTFRGELRDGATGRGEMELWYWGGNTGFLEKSFSGTLIAPNATIYLGSGPGDEFRGRFSARSLELRSGVSVVVADVPMRNLQSVTPFQAPHRSLDGARSGGCTLASGGLRPENPSWWDLLLLGVSVVAFRRRGAGAQR